MTRREFLVSSAALSHRPAMQHVPVRVKLDSRNRTNTIPANFLGLGYETSSIAAGVPGTSDPSYIKFVRKLCPSGVIRVGGNTSDDALYRASGESLSKPKGTIINQANLDRLSVFLQSTGWKLIWGLNLGSGNEAEAVAESKAVARAAGDKMLAFEIGNEPDLFGRGTAHRPASYSYDVYLREYRRYKAAIRRELPAAPFAGPDAASATDWVTRFATDEGHDLKLLTHHYYRECAGPASTIEKLLGPDPKLRPQLEKLQAASKAAQVPYRICEVNSFCGGGKPGVSDTLASALWVLDYMFTLASFEASGVNVETGVNQLGWISWYSPLVTGDRGVVSARPEYYGMLAFGPSLGGDRLNVDYEPNSLNLKVYAVASGNNVIVTIINRDSWRDARMRVDSKPRLEPKTLLRLIGPSLASKQDVTLRAARPPADLLQFAVPPSSAAILSCAIS